MNEISYLTDHVSQQSDRWLFVALALAGIPILICAQPAPLPTINDAPIDSSLIVEPTYTVRFEWPANGETNRFMLDGVQLGEGVTNYTATNVRAGYRIAAVISLSGRHYLRNAGTVQPVTRYDGVMFKTWTNGAWSAPQPWTKPIGTLLPQTAPNQLLWPQLTPLMAWVQREDRP